MQNNVDERPYTNGAREQLSRAASDREQGITPKTKSKPGNSKSKKKKSGGYKLAMALLKLVAVAGIIAALLYFVVGVYPLHGNSMYPMFHDGDLAITLKVGTQPVPGDVVTFKLDGEWKAARVKAVGAASVELEDGSLYVDDVAQSDDVFYPTDPGELEYPYEVGKGEAFLLNDYRTDMADSRSLGSIPLKDLGGKVVFLFRTRGF